ncbi:hypothetical protein ACFO0N_11590 [Halobium salinum]|uniref:Uncharacterized protein n=1 Tax=Halobium salinum TaxID=1364940 RepID=A0ABD5PCV1_9EURY|nr:hypothetical protein [Halobium salinum]
MSPLRTPPPFPNEADLVVLSVVFMSSLLLTRPAVRERTWLRWPLVLAGVYGVVVLCLNGLNLLGRHGWM